MKINLRPYQNDAISEIQKKFREGKKYILLVLFMGLGKTTVAARVVQLAAGNNKRVLVLAHRTFLITQFRDRFIQFGMHCGLIKAGFKEDRSQKIQIASIQTIKNRNLPLADIVIVDEAHHAVSDEYLKLLQKYKDSGSFILGLTATPFLLSKTKGLNMVFDDYVNTIQVEEAVKNEYVLDSKVWWSKAMLDLSGVGKSNGDYNSTELHKAFSTKNVEVNLINKYHEIIGNDKTILFCVNKQHCIDVTSALIAAGYKGSYVLAETAEKDRLDFLAKLKSGEYNFIANVDVYTEGFDLPELQAVVLVYETLSKAKYFQSTARGNRTLPEDFGVPVHLKKKPFYKVLDMGSNTKRFHPVETPFEISLEPRGVKGEGVAPIKECENCGYFMPAQAKFCPECKAEAPPSKKTKKEIKEEEFVELNKVRLRVAPYLDLPANRWNEIPSDLLLPFAKEKGFKQPKGWVKNILWARGEGQKKVVLRNYDEPDYFKQRNIISKGYFDKANYGHYIDPTTWQFIEETDREVIFEYKLAQKESVLP